MQRRSAARRQTCQRSWPRVFPSLPGFVFTTQAYAEQLERLFPRGFPAGTRLIRDALISATLTAGLKEEILSAHRSFQAERKTPVVCAIRSSATAENMAGASFAGQHESYYYIKEENLIDMAKACWGYLRTDAACSYRDSQGMDHFSVRMSVIVQEMILSDVSGITFAKDPVTGDDSLIITESS